MFKRTALALLLLLAAVPSADAAYQFEDITCETTATTGTGTATLAGALTGGYLPFATTVTSGNTVPYNIITGSGGSRKVETGDGVFTSPSTLTRVAAWSSDGVGAELNLAGTSTICLGWNTDTWTAGVANLDLLGLSLTNLTDLSSIDGTTETTLEAAIEGTQLQGYGTGVATWLGTPSVANLATALTDEAAGWANWQTTPSSANLRTYMTDEIGTGVLVFLGTPADDQVPVGDSASAVTWRTLPDVAAGQKLVYTQSTNTFSAGTDDDVPEVGDFTALVGGTGIDNNSGTLDFDATEVTPTVTWGAGSFTTMTFDAGASDTAFEFATGTMTVDIGGTNELTLTSTAFSPGVDAGQTLGTAALAWNDLFLDTGATINVESGDWLATHSAGILTVTTGDLRVTNNFTNATSVVTVGGAQTLTSKTLTSPTINGATIDSTSTLAIGATTETNIEAALDTLANVTSIGGDVTAGGDFISTDDVIVGDDLTLSTDGALINIGAGADCVITHAAGTLTLSGCTASGFAPGGSGITAVVEDTAPQLGGNLDANNFDFTETDGDISFQFGDNGDNGASLTVENDSDGDTGSYLYFFQNSDSPAAGDYIAGIVALGKNDLGTTETYVEMDFILTDPNNTSEDGRLEIYTMVGGALRKNVQFNNPSYGEMLVGNNSGYNAFGIASSDGAVGLMAANGNSEVRFYVATNHPFYIGTNNIGRILIAAAGDVTFTENVSPDTDGGSILGSAGVGWLDLFLTNAVEFRGTTDTTLVASAAGELTLEGDAVKHAGKQVMYIPAGSMVVNVTNPASCGATFDSGSNDLTLNVCNFADGASELRVDFGFAMPKAWNESTFTYEVLWTAASGSGTFQAEVGCVAISNDDVLNATVGTTVTQVDTLTTAGDLHVTPESSAITIAGTPAENDYVQCRLSRDTSVDTIAATISVIGIKVYWTDNASTLAE